MGGEGGGGDDALPSLTPQWMRGGGGRGASLTTGATAGGHHNKPDAVPQLPPQLVRSGSAERLNGSGPHLGPNSGGRHRRQHGNRNGRHHSQPQHQPPHHHPVLNMDLHAVPPTLAPAPPVPASPKPPRSGIAPQPDPFARRSGSAVGGEHGPGAGPAADGGGGSGGGMGGGGMPPGASMADAVGTWGHAGHTTTAGGYSNFDRGRGSGAAVAGPTSPGARVPGAAGRGRLLPASPRRVKGGGGHRGVGARGGTSKLLGTGSWGEFDEEERPRPPRLRTASFSPRAAAGDRGGDLRGDRGGDRSTDGGGGSLRSALLSPKRGSWRSSGSSDPVWTSRLAETPLQGRAPQQPGSAKPSAAQRSGSAELGRSRSLPLGDQGGGSGGGGSQRVARAGSGGSVGSGGSGRVLGNGASGDGARGAGADPVLSLPADGVIAPSSKSADAAAGPADARPAAAAAAPAVGAAPDGAAAANPAQEPPSDGSETAITPQPLAQSADDAASAPGAPAMDLNPATSPAPLLLGLSLRPGPLRSGGAPKPYSPAKHAFGTGGSSSYGGDAAEASPPASDLAQASAHDGTSRLNGRLVDAATAAEGDSPNAAAAVAEVAKEVKEDAKAADAEELLPASSGNLLPASEDSFLASLGWTDCTEETGLGVPSFRVTAFGGQQQNGGASMRQYH